VADNIVGTRLEPCVRHTGDSASIRETHLPIAACVGAIQEMLRMMTFEKWSEVLGLSEVDVQSVVMSSSSGAGKRARATSDDQPPGN